MIQFALIALSFVVAQSDAVDQAKSIQDYVGVGIGYSNLAVPNSLESDDVNRWAKMLGASDAQREFMQIEYSKFVQHHNEFLDREAPTYLSKCAAFSAFAGSRQKPDEYLKAAVDAQRAWRHLSTQLERLENEYIDAIAPGLTDVQSDKLYLLRNEASRRQSRSFSNQGRWTNVDLRLVWDAMAGDQVADSDVAQMSIILDDYEARVTPLLRNLSTAYWSGTAEMSKVVVRQQQGQISGEEFHKKYESLWNAFGQANDRVREVTQQAVKQAEVSLSPEIARQFVYEAKWAAFPDLYPDATALRPLFLALTKDTTFDEEQRKLIASLQTAYETEYGSLCSQAEAFCIDWSDHESRGINGYQHQFLQAKVDSFLESRKALDEKWLAKLNDALGEDVVKAHLPPPVNLTRTPQQLKATSAGQLRPPTRPSASVKPEIPPRIPAQLP